MSQSEETTPREVAINSVECQLAMRKAIDDIRDDLIIAGADKVTLLENNRDKQKRLALSRSQIRNVVNESTQTRSREAITNFIRYQMGRQDGNAWRHVANNRKAFGKELIADIEEGAIENSVRKVCEAVGQSLKDNNLTTGSDELKREARAQIIKLYLAYLNRTFAYCETMDQKDQECWRDVEKIANRK